MKTGMEMSIEATAISLSQIIRATLLTCIREYYDAGHIVDLQADAMAHRIMDRVELAISAGRYGVVRITPDGKYLAQFYPGTISRLGEADARGIGHTRDAATLECLKHAEDSFGWHGGVRFVDYKQDPSAPF